jgi:hypothetical protein
VIALRLAKLVKGGEAAQKEAHRMVAEKIGAAQAAALTIGFSSRRYEAWPNRVIDKDQIVRCYIFLH